MADPARTGLRALTVDERPRLAGAPAAASHVCADQRYAWRGPALLVTTLRGECHEPDKLTGLYYREARHLRDLRLSINDASPWLCSDASITADEISFVFVYPELVNFGGGGTDISDDTTWTDDHGIVQRSIDVRLRHRIELTRMESVLTLTNRGRERAELKVTWHLDADFADVGEAFSGNREQKAIIACDTEGDALLLTYQHPNLPLRTRAQGSGPAPWRSSDRQLETVVVVEAQATVRLLLHVTPLDLQNPVLDDAGVQRRVQRVRRWREQLTRLSAPGDSTTVRTIEQALDDIASLATLSGSEDEWLSLMAGVPMYPALFGRDTITAGWQIPMFDRGAVIDASLKRLGRLQSDRVDDWRDEEPGRIPYQVRAGPLARLNLNPYSAYYADCASPLLFVIGLGHLFAWCGDKRCIAEHWDTARRILDWARDYGDMDGDGFLEYQTRSSRGTKNQGWKDSGNAILYDDGTPVPAPLGTCDLQGYWFSAQQLMAVMAWIMGERLTAKAYWRSAMNLKARFNQDWWVEEEGFFALALDEDKRQATSVTSNVGQCLATGIIDREHIPRVVGRLFAPDMFSGWGIRTLSTKHPSYNPLGYHVGTVWPVENATIVFGLRRFGFDQRALELAGAYFELSGLYERGRIPECVGGYSRAESPHPGAYPRANPLQTWNQSGYGLLLQSILGLQPVGLLNLLLVDPVLPSWLPEITLHDLRLANGRATLRFERAGAGTNVEVLEKRGKFHLARQQPPESMHAGPLDRFGALVGSIFHH